jgi:hypothetical protein
MCIYIGNNIVHFFGLSVAICLSTVHGMNSIKLMTVISMLCSSDTSTSPYVFVALRLIKQSNISPQTEGVVRNREMVLENDMETWATP